MIADPSFDLVLAAIRDPSASPHSTRQAFAYRTRMRCALAFLDQALCSRSCGFRGDAFHAFRIAKDHARSALVSKREALARPSS